jgi:catechol 1,2-dioxygenase
MTKPAPKSTTDAYGATFTEAVVAATSANTSPRLQEIMPPLIRHLHEFAREINLTVDEWQLGVDFVRLQTKESIPLLMPH